MYERFSVFMSRLLTVSVDDFKREDGQTVTEYGIVLGVLIVALATTVLLLDTGIQTFLTKITTKLSGLI
jgi:Flp pilus assembly pilin Flp